MLAVVALAHASSALVASSARLPGSIAASTPALAHFTAPQSLRSRPIFASATLEPQVAAPTAAEDAWIARTDLAAFKKDCQALGSRLEAEQGEADVKHLHKMVRWSNACGLIGLLTMWMAPNPITVAALSLWSMSRWTMIAHHTCHGGYNKQDDGTGRWTSGGFALGSLRKRVVDWFDWMLPEAWNVEHNNLHHFRLGESGDPDLVERNLDTLRTIKLPRPLKYVYVAFLACVWKWYYYAPNTYKQLKMQEWKKTGKPLPEEVVEHDPFVITKFFEGEARALGYGFRDYMKRVAGPYIALRFLALPAPLLIFGKAFFFNAVANLLLADVLSNIHTFIVIATNHAGDDLYKFEGSVTPKSGSFYMRQVVSSVNFRTGGDVNDFMHGWLNYQIEHHLWPQLSMLSYQKAAPELKQICAKHGVPYVQENVFRRLKKTADIMVGATSMRRFDSSWNKPSDAFVWK